MSTFRDDLERARAERPVPLWGDEHWRRIRQTIQGMGRGADLRDIYPRVACE